MFKLRIPVDEHTDVAAELDRIDGLAKKHHLDDSKALVLMQRAEDTLADLKKQDSETAAFGITVGIVRHLKTDDYDIVLELAPRKKPAQKKNLVSTLFGR